MSDYKYKVCCLAKLEVHSTVITKILYGYYLVHIKHYGMLAAESTLFVFFTHLKSFHQNLATHIICISNNVN